MPETPYQALSAADRRDALRVAEGSSPHRAFLLEKDIWVVATLHALFDAPFGNDLAFKGGTSLSKAYRAIRRFSEWSTAPTSRPERMSRELRIVDGASAHQAPPPSPHPRRQPGHADNHAGAIHQVEGDYVGKCRSATVSPCAAGAARS